MIRFSAFTIGACVAGLVACSSNAPAVQDELVSGEPQPTKTPVTGKPSPTNDPPQTDASVPDAPAS